MELARAPVVCRHIPGLQLVFGVTALSWPEWRAVLVLSAPVVLLDEALKFVSRGGLGAWGRAVSWACTFCWRSRRYMGVSSDGARYGEAGEDGEEMQKLRST